MSFIGPVNLLTSRGSDDCNIFSIKNFDVSHAKYQNILEKLVYMRTFEELSIWVDRHTNGHKFIACPAHSSYEDRNSCLNHLQELLLRTIQGKNKRKDGRDLKLEKAEIISDYYSIASILASTAWSYWQTYHLSNGNACYCIKNDEKNQQKSELQKAQIEYIGAAISFEKARKKGAFQETLDFEETIKIIENNLEY